MRSEYKSLISRRPSIPQNKSAMQCSRSAVSDHIARNAASLRVSPGSFGYWRPTYRSPLISVKRGLELAADILDGAFVDDLFTHQIGHVEHIDGPRRLGGDLGQVNINPDLKQRCRDQV